MTMLGQEQTWNRNKVILILVQQLLSAIQAILAAPMGVVHLMDMMMDMEALRNEVLLLLIGLTHSNQSIQQIAAFEGAFERLLNIVR